MSVLRSSSKAALTLFLTCSQSALAAEVTPFYHQSARYSPSYVLTQGTRTTVQINKPDERFQFRVVGGVVRQAIVEQWYQNRRIAVTYKLDGKRYKIAKIYITNLGTYYRLSDAIVSASTPLVVTAPVCSFEESELSKIAAVITSDAYKRQLLDESCKVLPMGGTKLLSLREYLNPTDAVSKGFLQCLNKMSADATTQNKKDQLTDLRASIIAMIKKEASGTPALKISCTEIDLDGGAAAEASPQIGSINFKIKGNALVDPDTGDALVDPASIRHTFVHELVHQTHPLSTEIKYEEALADEVATKCAPQKSIQIAEVSSSEPAVDLGDTDRFGGNFDPSIESVSTTVDQNKDMPVDIQSAVASMPPQSISAASVASMQEVAQNTTPANSNSVNAAFENVTEKPTQAFSATTTKVAQALVPSANAGAPVPVNRPASNATTSTQAVAANSASPSTTRTALPQVAAINSGGGSGIRSDSNPDLGSGNTVETRRPASSAAISRYEGPSGPTSAYDPKMANAAASSASQPSVLKGAQNFKTMMANNKETIVEEIIVPNSAGTGYTSRRIETPNTSPSQSIAAMNARAAQTQQNAQASANEASPAGSGGIETNSGSAGGSSPLGSPTNTTPVPAAASPRAKPSRGTASVTPSGGATSPTESSSTPAVEVSGVSFANTNIDGAGYQRYRTKIAEPAFKTSLEAAGILITRSGSLLSKPKTVSATYIDTGNALIYGGL